MRYLRSFTEWQFLCSVHTDDRDERGGRGNSSRGGGGGGSVRGGEKQKGGRGEGRPPADR